MKGFWFYQSLEAVIEKYPKAACHEKPPSSSRRSLSEENWKKTGGKPEENQRKSGGKHFEKSIKKQKEECISFANFNGDPDYINEEETNSKMVSLWNLNLIWNHKAAIFN